MATSESGGLSPRRHSSSAGSGVRKSGPRYSVKGSCAGYSPGVSRISLSKALDSLIFIFSFSWITVEGRRRPSNPQDGCASTDGCERPLSDGPDCPSAGFSRRRSVPRVVSRRFQPGHLRKTSGVGRPRGGVSFLASVLPQKFFQFASLVHNLPPQTAADHVAT